MLRNSTKVIIKTRDGDKTLTRRFLSRILVYSFEPLGSRINGWPCIYITLDSEDQSDWEFNFNKDEDGLNEFEKLEDAIERSEMDGTYAAQ